MRTPGKPKGVTRPPATREQPLWAGGMADSPGCRLLEGAGISMYLVVVGADL